MRSACCTSTNLSACSEVHGAMGPGTANSSLPPSLNTRMARSRILWFILHAHAPRKLSESKMALSLFRSVFSSSRRSCLPSSARLLRTNWTAKNDRHTKYVKKLKQVGKEETLILEETASLRTGSLARRGTRGRGGGEEGSLSPPPRKRACSQAKKPHAWEA